MLYDALTAALSANPILTVSLGGFAVAAGLRVLQGAPTAIGKALAAALTINVKVTSRYSVYNDVVGYLGHHVLPWSGRSLAPMHGNATLTTGYGAGLARYGDVLVFYRRTIDSGQNGYQNETLDLRFLCRDRAVPLRFVREAARTDEACNIRVRVVESEHGCERVVSKPKRSLASVHVDREVKASIVSAFEAFRSGEADYLARGIPYRFCAVFHGPPGTGKTSLIHALASKFDLSIVYAATLDGISRVAGSCGPDDLLVIEDIDSMANGLDRTDRAPNAPRQRIEVAQDGTPPLHALLNALDGFCTPHGLKVVITTNHVDRLDPALLRPGRADLLIEIGLLQDATVREMFADRYGAAEVERIGARPIAPISGAALQQILFRCPNASEAAAALARVPTPIALVSAGGGAP